MTAHITAVSHGQRRECCRKTRKVACMTPLPHGRPSCSLTLLHACQMLQRTGARTAAGRETVEEKAAQGMVPKAFQGCSNKAERDRGSAKSDSLTALVSLYVRYRRRYSHALGQFPKSRRFTIANPVDMTGKMARGRLLSFRRRMREDAQAVKAPAAASSANRRQHDPAQPHAA